MSYHVAEHRFHISIKFFSTASNKHVQQLNAGKFGVSKRLSFNWSCLVITVWICVFINCICTYINMLLLIWPHWIDDPIYQSRPTAVIRQTFVLRCVRSCAMLFIALCEADMCLAAAYRNVQFLCFAIYCTTFVAVMLIPHTYRSQTRPHNNSM